MKKNYIQFAIDIVMAIMFLLFFNTRVLGGLAYHEIAGLIFAVIFFTHVSLNLNWVKNVTMKIFDKNLPWKTRGNYALNLLLLISMCFVIFSGIVISRVVFPNINLGNEIWFRTAHTAFSFLTIILVGVHIGIHWQWIVNVFKKMIQYKSKKKWIGYAAKIAAALIFIFGVYEIQQTGFVNRVASVTSVFSGGSSGMTAGQRNFNFDSGQRPSFTGGQEPKFADGQTPGFTNGQRPDLNNGNRIQGTEHNGGSADAFDVIITYSAVTAVFVVITYYIRKLTLKKRKRKLA